jgi:hypothetical protein
MEMHEELPSMAGVKGKKYNRILDNFTWNVRILRGQVDLLQSCRKECQQSLAQVTFSDRTSILQQYISELFHNSVTELLPSS